MRETETVLPGDTPEARILALEDALRERTRERDEAIRFQSASSEVLKAISQSAFDLQRVLDTLVETAVRLCDADMAFLWNRDVDVYRVGANFGYSAEYQALLQRAPWRPGRGTVVGRTALSRATVQVADIAADPDYEMPENHVVGGARTTLGVPLLRQGEVIGVIALSRRRVEAFTERQIALLENFASQAVIASEHARLLSALRGRSAELTRSVAELRALEEVLRAVSASLELDTVLSTIITHAARLSQADEGTIYEFEPQAGTFMPKATFGMSEDRVAALLERRVRLGETPLGRAGLTHAPVHVVDVQIDDLTAALDKERLVGIRTVLAIPLVREERLVGGLVVRRREVQPFEPATVELLQTFAAQSVLAIGNARLFADARQARAAAEAALADLRAAQDRLVQSEKLASLGQLTAGIAHEIKNPLNFVNNFAEVSADLVQELQQALADAGDTLAAGLRAEVDEVATLLRDNLAKVVQHGKRADSIVKNMLAHSREGGGERRRVDLNSVVLEALNLAYHGARAERQGFNVTLHKDLDPSIGEVELFPQEFSRVLLNLIGNGFHAAHGKRLEGTGGEGFQPTLSVTTRACGDAVEVRVRDNGTGIPAAVRARIFEPFFTTKPPGEGTGLGLSLSHDIVVKQHRGTITVETEPGAFTEFVVTLPRGATPSTGVDA